MKTLSQAFDREGTKHEFSTCHSRLVTDRFFSPTLRWFLFIEKIFTPQLEDRPVTQI